MQAKHHAFQLWKGHSSLHILWFVAALVLGGCVAESDHVEQGPITDQCSSGWYWMGGTHPSVLMTPGDNCIGCHAADEGPTYTAAGTVFGAIAEQNDCVGIEGVEVVIKDATGKEFSLWSNAVGNFFTSASIALPYTAHVTYQGQVRKMYGPQMDLNCANCHTPRGRGGAVGRVFVEPHLFDTSSTPF